MKKYKKLKCVVYAPVDTYSGYGSRSRDFVKALKDLKDDEWDIRIISCRWGGTPQNFLTDHEEEWGWIKKQILPNNQLGYKPDMMFWVTVPNEPQQVGKWNCVVTAGIETTICAPQWIEGINRMDLCITSSNHSKNVFENTHFDISKDQNAPPTSKLQAKKPIEVLFEGVDTNKYKVIKNNKFKNKNLYNAINSIPENFAFLFVGAWLQGELGEDRKNVALLVRSFYELFKNKENPPALILKTHGASSSYIDRRTIQTKINALRKEVKNAKTLPNVYLLHGDFSDQEINELYNHPKVKCMVNLTKGEGFGRPLLEFSTIGKPIISTNWSGHIDFLSGNNVALCGGKLQNVHPSAQQKDMILPESLWFQPDPIHVGHFFNEIFNNYQTWLHKAREQKEWVMGKFTYKHMVDRLGEILNEHLPEFPKEVQLEIPKIEKINIPKKPVKQDD